MLLSNLKDMCSRLSVVIFEESMILDQSVDDWPLCDVLIAFHSDGFPLLKAMAYQRLRQPFCINDLHGQVPLLDRRLMYRELRKMDVPLPRFLVLNRPEATEVTTALDGSGTLTTAATPAAPVPTSAAAAAAAASCAAPWIDGLDYPYSFLASEWSQAGDVLTVDGLTIRKPFVEKHANAERHDHCIYYPSADGSRVRQLFRKIGSESSRLLPEPQVAVRDGSSFVYEEFIPTQNMSDIKGAVGT